MGDVAMAVPILKAFTKQYPNVKLTVLTQAFFSPFFQDLQQITVYPADIRNKHKGLKGLYKLSKIIATLDIDAVADLHNVIRSNVLKFLLPKLKFIQINKGRKEKKALIKGQCFAPLKTTHKRYADVFESLGFSINLSKPTFPKPKSLNNKILKLIGEPHTTYIGIAPFAAHESKMYPLDVMELVISELSKTYTILLFGGGAQEIATLSTFENKYSNTINTAGKLNLKEELAIISNLSLMLSMDSANAHIAAMLGVKVVSIWGVTHPYAGFSPFNQPEHYALIADRLKYPKIPSSIYGNKYPKHYKEAAGSIAPKTVIAKVKAVLERP